jgi:hypothetical protein
MKKDLISREEIERCLRRISDSSNNRSAQEALLELLGEMQISLDEPKVEDSIDGTRMHVTYTLDIRRIRGGTDQYAIRFQYLKEIPIDYYNVPIRLRDNSTAAAGSAAVNDVMLSHNNNNNANAEDTIIESYDEVEKAIPTLYEVLGLLKRVYYIPEDFSNRLVVDHIHKLRNMFSKDEIVAFPAIDPNDRAGLIPI